MMHELLEYLQLPFNQRALLAAILIGAVNGHFSGYVVLRKSALFTGALSHSLLPGTAIGFILFGVSAMSAFSGSLIVSLITGLGALAIASSSRIDKDAARLLHGNEVGLLHVGPLVHMGDHRAVVTGNEGHDKGQSGRNSQPHSALSRRASWRSRWKRAIPTSCSRSRAQSPSRSSIAA